MPDSDDLEAMFAAQFPEHSCVPPKYWIAGPKPETSTLSPKASIQVVEGNAAIPDIHDVRRPKPRNGGHLRLVTDKLG